MTYSKILSLIAGLPQQIDYSNASNILGLANLQLLGSTSGYIQHVASATTTSYTLTWPAAQAAMSGYALINDGSGGLSWAAAASPLSFSDSLVNTGGTVTLVNDTATPGATKYYGTNGSSTLGYYSLPVSGINQLTGDVTAGPGTGSQAASLVATTNSTLTTLSGLTTASALSSVGTITSGTWNATTIAINHGGTGATSASGALSNLGIRSGSMSIGNGASTVTVTYSSTLGTTSYSLTCTILNTTDSLPQYQPITITSFSATGFTASLNEITDSANYVLHYQAILNA